MRVARKHRLKIIAGAAVAGAVIILVALQSRRAGCFQGYVEGEYVYVASPVGGRLEQLFVRRGEQAAAGAALFRLDFSPEREELEQSRARLDLADKNLARARALVASGAITRQEFDRYTSEQISAQQAVTQGEWKIRQKEQVSPSAGFVQDTLYTVGEYVPPGKPIVCLLPPENIKVRFFADAKQRGGIQLGQRVRLKVYGVSGEFYGRVNYLSSNAEYTPPVIYSNNTRGDLTFMLEVMPDRDALPRLFPGQPVEVTPANDRSP